MIPSAKPSELPSSQPSSHPTHPSFAPTQYPTFAPIVPGTTPVVQIDGSTSLQQVGPGSVLTSTSINTFTTTLQQKSGAQDVGISSATKTGRRKLVNNIRTSIIEVEAVGSSTWLVKFVTKYYLANYPGLNATALAAQQINIINDAFTSGDFQALLRSNAVLFNATQLLDAETDSVELTSTVVSPSSESSSSDRHEISDGAIAGIVIGSFIGAMVLFYGIYFVVTYERSRADKYSAENVAPSMANTYGNSNNQVAQLDNSHTHEIQISHPDVNLNAADAAPFADDSNALTTNKVELNL
jgi:hypothetical protein